MPLTTEPLGLSLTVATLLFALISGTNDGSTLLALGVRVSRMPLLLATFILATAVVVAPILVGTQVAETFLTRLVGFDEYLGDSTLIGVAGALTTVIFLASRGLPTSLTVGILGGLVGAGVGRGLDVYWDSVALVVLIALGAPAVGFLVAFAVSRLAMRIVVRGEMSRLLDRLHFGAFGVQCLAYGVNDGQKMLAVSFVAAGSSSTSEVEVDLPATLVIAAVFAIGTLLGLRRYSRTVVFSVFLLRPASAVAAEVAAAASVLGTGLLGSPVSTIQTVVTSIIGSGAHEGIGRIRWESAVRIGWAWVYTFPLTFVLGVVMSRLSESVL